MTQVRKPRGATRFWNGVEGTGRGGVAPEVPMKFKEIVARITGLSVPVFGVQWSPSEPEVAAARRVISYLEDRRVLYQPELDGEPEPLRGIGVAFIKQASIELGLQAEVVKRDLGRVLLEVEDRVREQLHRLLRPKPDLPAMSASDQEAALGLLRDPKLLDRILSDYNRCGVVGEETNKLIAYLAAVSRKLDEPLAA